MMKKSIVGIVTATLIATAIGGCSSSKTPAQKQADARAAILATETAWIDVAQGCVDVASATGNVGLLQTCDGLMTPVKDALLSVEDSVDTWASADQQNFSCTLHNAVKAIDDAAAAVTAKGGPLPKVVADAKQLVDNLNIPCVSDGGAG